MYELLSRTCSPLALELSPERKHRSPRARFGVRTFQPPPSEVLENALLALRVVLSVVLPARPADVAHVHQKHQVAGEESSCAGGSARALLKLAKCTGLALN